MKAYRDNKKALYEAPLVVVIFLMIVFFISNNLIFIKIGFVIGLLSLLSKSLAGYISAAWQKIIKALGFVNAHILLTIVFAFILVPISSVYKIFNKDTLNLKSGKNSYFTERNHVFSSKDMENPW